MLSEGIRGNDFAKELHTQGSRNLYLATGNYQDSLPGSMTWIKEIFGKKAPWSKWAPMSVGTINS